MTRCIIQLCEAKILDFLFKSWFYPPDAQTEVYEHWAILDQGFGTNGLHSDLKLSSNANTFKHKIKDAFFARLQKEEDIPYIYY